MTTNSSEEARFQYEESRVHKAHTRATGPPRWMPDKEKCPLDLSLEEREELLRQSEPVDGTPENPRRYAVRRTAEGPEFYECKLTRYLPDGTVVVHGHPTRRIPPSVLRRMRDRGLVTDAEYRQFVKELS